MMRSVWFLRLSGLFDGVSPEDIAGLVPLFTDCEYGPGDDVIGADDGGRIFVVKVGRVQILRGEVAVAILGHGQFFGTEALAGAPGDRQRAVALEDAIVCNAPAAEFLAAIAARPQVAVRVIEALSAQLHELSRAVARSTKDPAERRLVDLVVGLADRGKTPIRVGDFSQAELARMIGVSREVVSRTIAEWERRGYVSVGQRELVIKDEAGLRSRVGEKVPAAS